MQSSDVPKVKISESEGFRLAELVAEEELARKLKEGISLKGYKRPLKFDPSKPKKELSESEKEAIRIADIAASEELSTKLGVGVVPEEETLPKVQISELDRIRAAIRKRMGIVTIAVPREAHPKRRQAAASGPKRPIDPVKATYIFAPSDKLLLGQFLKSKLRDLYSGNIEIEASFGTTGGKTPGFKPGFKSPSAFKALKRSLDKRAKTSWFTKSTSFEKVETMDNYFIRRITTANDMHWELKIRRKQTKQGVKLRFENPMWGIRVHKSIEKNLSDADARKELDNNEFEPTLTRKKTRYSYYGTSSSKSEFYGIRFDLTSVEEIRHRTKTSPEFSYVRNEVEIERINKEVSSNVFIDAIKQVLMWSQQTVDFSRVIALPERKFAVKLHNNLFWYDINAMSDAQKQKFIGEPYLLYNNYWNKPENIKIKNLLNPRGDWEVTIKLNGVRRFLLVDTYATYMIGPPYDVIKVGPGNKKLSGTLIDGEAMEVGNNLVFHCFDILFYRKENLRQKRFVERKEVLNKVFKLLDKKEGIKIKLKKYYNEGTLYQRINSALDDASDIDDELQDGLIFQPSHYYKNKQTLKWKPPEKLTIDFLVVKTNGKIQLLVGDRKLHHKDVPFKGTKRHPQEIKISDMSVGDESIFGKIVEFGWGDGEFIPIRIRDDRTRPNDIRTANDVWNDIKDPITEHTIRGNTLKVIRKYLNDVKSTLLNTNFSRGDTILDIGSGRGGDLSKWEDIGLKKVYALEPNNENLEELIRRKDGMKKMETEVEVINKGAEETEIIQKALKRTKLDGIVSFQSLTFFPKSQKLYSGLLETINLLPEGGKFIGIVMDGEKTRQLLEKAKEKDIKELKEQLKTAKNKEDKEEIEEELKVVKQAQPVFSTEEQDDGSQAFIIYQASKFTTNKIGDKIVIDIPEKGSMVRNQTEWLFYFRPFQELLEKNGFIYKGNAFRVGDCTSNFVDCGDIYNILPESSQIFSGLIRVFVFVKSKGYKDFSSARLKAWTVKNLPNPYETKLCITGIPPTPANIVHAVFQAKRRGYRNAEDKEEFINKWRVRHAKKLTVKAFQKLKFVSKFEKYKTHLADPEEWLGAERILELLSDYLKVNIYILIGKTKGRGKVTSIEASTLFSNCPDMYKKEKAIVLYTTDSLFYSLVGRPSSSKGCSSVDENTYVFNQDDIVIQKIFKQVCSRSSI